MLPPFYISLLSLISVCQGFPDGAPVSQCESMVPGHGLEPQDNKNAPFEIKVKKGRYIGFVLFNEMNWYSSSVQQRLQKTQRWQLSWSPKKVETNSKVFCFKPDVLMGTLLEHSSNWPIRIIQNISNVAIQNQRSRTLLWLTLIQLPNNLSKSNGLPLRTSPGK